MANKIGIVLALDGEAQFTQGMRNAKTAASNLQKDLRTLKSDFKENANSMDYLSARQEKLTASQSAYQSVLEAAKKGLANQKSVYKEQQSALEDLKKKYDQAKTALSNFEKTGDTTSNTYKEQKKAVEDYATAISKQELEISKCEGSLSKWEHQVSQAEHDVRANSKAVDENAKYLNEAKTSADNCATSIDKYGKEVKTAGDKAETSGSKMGSMFEKIKTGALLKVGAIATSAVQEIGEKAIEAAKYIVDVGSTFEASMSKVEALSGATGSDLEALSQKAQELGRTTQFSASEAADALSAMALAGWNTNEMLSGIDGVLQLAAASGMDLASASDAVAGYLAAFNMEASESSTLADVMATAQAKSKTTTDQLAEAYGTCATNLTQAGQEMTTTTALLEGLASVNDTGSSAGTKLSAVMAQITKNMKDGKIQIGDTEVAVTDSTGAFRDMVDIVADVEAATDGMTDAQKAQALQTTFNRQSMAGMNELLSVGSDKLRDYKNDLENSEGAASHMASVMNDNLPGAITQMNSATEGLGTALYEKVKGPLTDAVKIATNIINGITDAITPEKTELEKFIEDIRTSNEETNKLLEAAESDLDQAEAKALELETYKNTILSLQAILDEGGELNTFQLYQMKTAVNAVSGEVPAIGKNFDEATGKVDLTREAIENLITQAQETAMQTAITNALQKDLEAVTQASFNYEKAVIAVKEAEEQYSYWSAQNRTAPSAEAEANIEKYSAALELARQELKETEKTQSDATESYELAKKAAANLAEEQEKTSKGYSRLVESGELAADANSEVGESASDAAGDLDELSEKTKELTEEEQKAAEAYEAHSERMKSALSDAASAIKEEFASVKKSIEDTFSVDLGSEWDGGLDQTVEQMTSNLESQIEGMEQYAANLEAVSQHVGEEITPEFMEYLESMGADGANILAHIAKTFEEDNGAEKVKDLSDKYMQSLELSDEISDVGASNVVALKQALGELGSAPEEWSGVSKTVKQKLRGESGENVDAIRESFSSAVEEAKSMGVQIPEGLAEGIESNDNPTQAVEYATSELHSAILGHVRGLAEIAKESGIEIPKNISEGIEGYSDNIVDAYDALLQLLSDNNVQIGEQASQAMAEGTENATGEVEAADETVAQNAASSAEDQKGEFQSAGEEHGSQYSSGIESKRGDAVSAAANLAQGALSAAKTYENSWYSVGVSMASGVKSGILSKAQEVANQAAAMVTNALSAARSAIDSHSPSRKFRDLVGKSIGEGTAFGIKLKTKQTEDAVTEQLSKTLIKAQTWISKNKSKIESFGDSVSDATSYTLSTLTTEVAKKKFGVSKHNYSTKTDSSGKTTTTKTQKTVKEYYDDIYDAAEDYLSKMKTLYDVSDQEELDYWETVKSKLKVGTDAWYEACDKIKELQEDIAVAQAEAESDRYDAIVSNAEDAVDGLKAAGKMGVKTEIEYWKNILTQLKKGTTQYETVMGKIDDLKAKIGTMTVANDLLDNYETYFELSERAEMEYWDFIRKQYEEGTADRIAADAKYFSAKKTYTERLKEIEDDYAEKIKDKQQEYIDALEGRKKAIVDAFGLFDAFESNSATGEELLFNLQAQAAGYEEWSSSLDELRNKGILSDEVMEVLTEKGPSEIAAIKALLMLTDDQLKQYQAAYDRKQSAAQAQAEKDTASVKATVETEIKALKESEQTELGKVNQKISSELGTLATNIRTITEDQTDALVAVLAETSGAKIKDETIKALGLTDVVNAIRTARKTGTIQNIPSTSSGGTTGAGASSSGTTTQKPAATTTSNTATAALPAVGGTTVTVNTAGKSAAEVAASVAQAQLVADNVLKGQIKAIINSAPKKTSLTAAEKKNGSELWKYVQSKYKRSITNKDARDIAALLGISTSVPATASQKNKILAALKKKGLQGGARSVTGGYEWIDELLDTQGPEMIVRRSDNAILTRLKAGDSVIPANLTDNLWKWGAINPDTIASGAEMNARLAGAFQAQALMMKQGNDEVIASLATIISYLPAIAAGMNLSVDGKDLASALGPAMSVQLAAQTRRRR